VARPGQITVSDSGAKAARGAIKGQAVFFWLSLTFESTTHFKMHFS
jgi:hypothetical protein